MSGHSGSYFQRQILVVRRPNPAVHSQLQDGFG